MLRGAGGGVLGAGYGMTPKRPCVVRLRPRKRSPLARPSQSIADPTAAWLATPSSPVPSRRRPSAPRPPFFGHNPAASAAHTLPVFAPAQLNKHNAAQFRKRDPAFPRVEAGILVPGVHLGSPAERAGLRPGDCIIGKSLRG